MQTSNSTPVDVRYTVESGGTRGPKAPSRTLLGVKFSESLTLPPYTYKVGSSDGSAGTVHFYTEQKGEWVHVASGSFTDPNALVTLVGRSGQYRVEVLYPQAA